MDAYHQSLYTAYQNSGKYTTFQLRELELGLKQGLQVGFYANPVLLPEQMAQIRQGLEHGVDVTLYSGSYWYQASQMAELRQGLESGIDISYYDDVSYPAELMRIIRMGLESNLDVVWYANPIFNISQASLIYEGLRQGLDVRFYADPSYESEQMLVIKKGLESHLDVRIYTDKCFSFMQMTQIRQGLELGLNVQLYAKSEYDEKQMWQIKSGMMEGLDITCYANPAFQANQMQEIRLGLKSGIDTSLYCNPAFTYEEMRQIRTIFTRHSMAQKAGWQAKTPVFLREDTIERLPERPAETEREPIFHPGDVDSSTIPKELSAPDRIEDKLICPKTPENVSPIPKDADFHFKEPVLNEKRLMPPSAETVIQTKTSASEKHKKEVGEDVTLPNGVSRQMVLNRPDTAQNAMQPLTSSSSDIHSPVNAEKELQAASYPYEPDRAPVHRNSEINKPSGDVAESAPMPSSIGEKRPAGAPQERKKRHNVFYNLSKAANAGRPAMNPRELFGTENQADTTA